MSFIISEKQHLASSGKRSNYKPFWSADENCQTFKIDTNFGHPLYSSVSDIVAAKVVAAHPVTVPVIPDGCISLAFYGKEEGIQGKICGLIDEIKKIELQPDDTLLLMRFQPSAAASILQDSASTLVNNAYDISDYIRNGNQIIAVANKELSIQEKAMRLSKLIRIRMTEDDSSYLVKYCTDRIFEKNGNIKVSELGIETGYSERYLGKVFEKYVGVSPKIYCEIMRLQNSLKKLMECSDQEPLINLALDCGFFDHAHMNRCYKRFLHCSSGMLRKMGFDCLDYNEITAYL